MKKKIKTKNSEIWIEGKILMIRMRGELEIRKFQRQLENIKYIIVDISDLKRLNLKARRIFAGEYSGIGVRKIAIICKNPLSKTIASFFLGTKKLNILTELFDDIEDAEKWLREDEY